MAWYDWLFRRPPATPPLAPPPSPLPIGSLTLQQYWMGRDVAYGGELTPQIRDNALVLINRVNKVLGAFGRTPPVNSGWRPRAVNDATPGAARNSRHLTGQAVDLQDRDGALNAWCVANIGQLAAAGLWLEDRRDTPSWCHLQSVSPASGTRVFRA